ncbi:hypothetical protein [Edaphocola flava]|jgi:hypothetical protein|uniref:hypothetical protein n=1 Tax=Edaphocola flava TaxID=2499629 RepID=UPI00100A6DF0|nr:hypothetical protein [Edaphocola flava]
MKKKVLYVTAVASILLLQSCKRDYTCSCVSLNNGEYSTKDTAIENSTKADAIFNCELIEGQKQKDYIENDSKDTVKYCNLNKS